MMRYLVTLIVAVTLLAACQRPNVEVVNYRCGELTVSAVFHGNDRAELAIGSRKLELALVPSASGAKYADGQGIEFWTKGLDEAMLTLAGEAMRNCSKPAGN
jgi:membrane-bound inhibitor of C-type lysozyme